MLREHADPARRVAGDDESFVVDARVGVGPVVAEHGVDHAQELVGGGEDGSLVAQAGGQRPVIPVDCDPVVRAAAWAHSASVARNVGFPRRARPERRLPALVLLPGAIPIHETGAGPPPSRRPSWSSVLWTRLRAQLRSPTSLRR